jgi:hypothetical protein
MMEMYQIVGIFLVVSGFFDIVVLPRIVARTREEALPSFVSAIIWLIGLATILVGVLIYLRILDIF